MVSANVELEMFWTVSMFAQISISFKRIKECDLIEVLSEFMTYLFSHNLEMGVSKLCIEVNELNGNL